MRTTVALFTLLAGLAGCASGPEMELRKAGGTTALLEQDRRQCDYEAGLATASIMASDPIQAGWNRGNLAYECLMARGWSPEPKEAPRP